MIYYFQESLLNLVLFLRKTGQNIDANRKRSASFFLQEHPTLFSLHPFPFQVATTDIKSLLLAFSPLPRDPTLTFADENTLNDFLGKKI